MDRIKEALAAYFAGREDVLFAYLHGSALERPDPRDVNVAVYLDPAPGSGRALH